MFFNDKKSTVVGMDIGTASIKSVSVTKNGETLSLDNYNELYFAPYVGKNIGEYVRLGSSELCSVIVDSYNELKVKADKLVIGLPASSCIFRVISLQKIAMSKLDKSLLPNILKLEFKKFVPQLNTDNYTFTFSEVGYSDEASSFLVLAIHNDYLSDVNDAAKKIGLEYIVQPNIFGGIRILPRDIDPNVVIVNIGANNINIAFINNHKLVGVENVEEGINKLIFNVRNSTLIDYNSAREIVLSFDYQSTDTKPETDIIKLSTERIINQIIYVLNSYELRYNVKYSKVYVGGSSAKITNTESFYKSIMNREVVVVKPFERVSMPVALENVIEKDSSVFMNALGLAISSFE